MKKIDLTGQKFGRLTVVFQSASKVGGRVYWHCVCECKNEKDVSGKELRRGTTQSCGCLRKEETSKRRLKHGDSETRLYYIWLTMKQRCEKPMNEKSKKNYRDRGIKVCHEWHDFSIFREWALANGYADNLTIDRKNNNSGYYPENCWWVDAITQANNRRSNRILVYNNESYTVAQWAKKLGFLKDTLYGRLKKGWDVEKVLMTPTRRRT